MKIGNIEIKNKVALAPMAGISDAAYMKICENMGASYVVTELISAEAIVRGNKKTFDMLNGVDDLNIPFAIQLFGSNSKTMASAAKIICELHSKCFIDINMGCPVSKVAISANSGSALMKDINKAKEIVKEVVNNVNVPVTVKIRSGWDDKSINAIEFAKAMEEVGASAIVVHPRTRSQGYSGKADWSIIKKVKENVSIPVIGNGDIKSYLDAKKMLRETDCDAIMIGRATLGNPWVIKECINYLEKGIIPKKVNADEKINMIKYHLDLLLKTKKEKVALLEIRSHIAWYLKGLPKSKEIKEAVFRIKSKGEIIDILDGYLKEIV